MYTAQLHQFNPSNLIFFSFALFPLGNPLDCSCDMLWLHAWYKQTNSYPGPRCRDRSLLIEQRLSKADCSETADNRLNQVLLTNDHGDVFKRQMILDDCVDVFDHENVSSSPTESVYFEQHFVDYPNIGNEVDRHPHEYNASMHIPNRTLLHYNKHKYHPNHQRPYSSTPFTFFGYPFPSLSNLWGGEGRKSTSRSSTNTNGKSRMRNFRPRPDEFIDSFQHSRRAPHFHEPSVLPTSIGRNSHNNAELDKYGPNEQDLNVSSHGHTMTSPNQIEKGGFIPLLPGIKGFTPIKNPYDSTQNSTRITESRSTERPFTNPDSIADESMHAANSNEKNSQTDDIENKYPVKLSTLAPSDVKALYSNTSLEYGTQNINTKEVKYETESRPNQITPIVFIPHSEENKDNDDRRIAAGDNIPSQITTTPAVNPFTPNAATHSISGGNNRFNTTSINQTQNRNVLSALLAPGAQNIFRAGRPTITKVFSTTIGPQVSSATQPNKLPSTQQTEKISQVSSLPLAEEYLRTKHQPELNQPQSSIDKKITSINNATKSNMDWYFSNYNRSKYHDHVDLSSLNRFRSSTNSNSAFTIQTSPIAYTLIVSFFSSLSLYTVNH